MFQPDVAATSGPLPAEVLTLRSGGRLSGLYSFPLCLLASVFCAAASVPQSPATGSPETCA